MVKDKLRRLVEGVNEYEESFPSYCQSIDSALDIVFEINDYIRERCAEILTPKHTLQLDEIKRDVCIIKSRMSKLRFQLKLVGMATKRARCFCNRKDITEAMVEQRLRECCDVLIDWRNLNRDFQETFRIAEQRWHTLETAILAEYDE